MCDNSALIFQARDLLKIMFEKDAVTLAFWAREAFNFSASFSSEGRRGEETKLGQAYGP